MIVTQDELNNLCNKLSMPDRGVSESNGHGQMAARIFRLSGMHIIDQSQLPAKYIAAYECAVLCKYKFIKYVIKKYIKSSLNSAK